MSIQPKLSTWFVAALFLLGSGAVLASPLITAIELAEQQYGGRAFEAEIFREDGQRVVEIELLRNNQILEIVYDADTLQVIETENYNWRRRINRATAAVAVAQIPLADAARRARRGLNGGWITEVKLRVTGNESANGRRYTVEIRKDRRDFDVIVNALNGSVVRIIRD